MERLLYRPIEAADAIGVSRTRIYQVLASGELPSIRIGTSVRVPADKLREWIDAKSGAGDERSSRERLAREPHSAEPENA
jgi:excisionase family DNA binding protein